MKIQETERGDSVRIFFQLKKWGSCGAFISEFYVFFGKVA
jgi:hypothetical protein